MGSKSAIGIGNGICFKQVRDKGGGSYIDPLVRDSIVGLWKFDQNTNESPTRNIIKNTIKGKGGDLELLNFGYKLNSGYNGYSEDFTSWTKIGNFVTITDTSLIVTNGINKNWLLARISSNSTIESFRVKITGIPSGGTLNYLYTKSKEDTEATYLNIKEDGVYVLPSTVITDANISIGFSVGYFEDYTGLTIEQLPLYEGALVTDGKDDMIVSQKTVQEMLGGSNVCTVMSMIHTISSANNSYEVAYTNCIIDIDSPNNHIRNNVGALGKTGIYGYKCSNLSTQTTNTSIINNILGDKNDYSIGAYEAFSSASKFSVIGFGNGTGLSEVAIYWTFIADKVLTTDEINQIIAYFKLDKYVTPQVIYDVKKQGLSNDTPEADWYLKDFSGNGHDMQLYNYAKKGNSGVGRYSADFKSFDWTVGISQKQHNKATISLNGRLCNHAAIEVDEMKVNIIGNVTELIYWYIANPDDTARSEIRLTSGINTLPKSYAKDDGQIYNIGFAYISGDSEITITQIPDYEGALVSDGKDDYGKAEGLPIFKDYTVAADRALIGDGQGAFMTKSSEIQMGAFGLEIATGEQMSFGNSLHTNIVNKDRSITYMSTYSYNGQLNTKGTREDGSYLCLATIKPGDSRFSSVALYSMLLFPYSLSEFLLERQLKKYKLGTLYPDMVEVRPIVKSNTDNYMRIEYRNGQGGLIQPGSYLPVGSILRISVVLNNTLDEVSSLKVNGVDIPKSNYSGNNFWIYDATVTKSPQKINITIDEYIRFEDIVQPYPAIVNIPKVDGGYYTYGEKIPVGYKFNREGLTNLLRELYSITGFWLNDVEVKPGEEITVSKIMVCRTNATWKLNTTEPHAIYSPQKLNIPNSSLKILGYVPDLTGKGNHGKLNNFAYALNSGANGYLVDFTTWSKINAKLVTDNKIVGDLVGWICYLNVGKPLPTFKVFISGIPNGGILRFIGSELDQILQNGENTIQGVELTTAATGFISSDNSLDWSNLVIQQIGEHEGSICFDGTDDHITIPNIIGGKCVMAKVKINNISGVIYDQRRANVLNKSWVQLNLNQIAFEQKAVSTYIDGVLNHNITCSNLQSKTVNITCELEIGDTSGTYQPTIGSSYAVGYTTNINLYEFMIFPEIPSEDEIKKLNDVMGIEGGYVESPNYYWDAYGKSNNQADDIDKDIPGNFTNTKGRLFDKSIQGLATINIAVQHDILERALQLNNVAYNSESGYEGWLGVYDLTKALNYSGSSKNNWARGGTFIKGINRNNITGCGYGRAKMFDDANNILKFKVKITGLVDNDNLRICQYDTLPAIEQKLHNGVNEVVLDVTNTTKPEFRSDVSFRYPPLENDVDFEFLYEYPNGLLLDGVEDHAVNTVIPAVTDFAAIIKRKYIGDTQPNNASILIKGDKINAGGINNACLMEYAYNNKYNNYIFGQANSITLQSSDISYLTSNSYNGTVQTKGTNNDTVGLSIGASDSFPKAVFYKLMFYTKTIDQLSINMLKNLFERDELIDVTNPIFKKEEL